MSTESKEVKTPLFRWINVQDSPYMEAVTVPDEYKHLSRKELAKEHPGVINAMKAATLDHLRSRDMLTDFEYMFADLVTNTDDDWIFSDSRALTKEEKHKIMEKQREDELERRKRLQKLKEENERREKLSRKIFTLMTLDPSFFKEMEERMDEKT